MQENDDSPITAAEAKALFAEWAAAPALVLAVSGGPDSGAMMWLGARGRRGPRPAQGSAAGGGDHRSRFAQRGAARGARRETTRQKPRSAASHLALDRCEA